MSAATFFAIPDLEWIFEEHRQMVFRTAYYVTGNTADAEDAMQTVFLRLAGREPGAEAVGNMPGFLHRSALNAARDLVRRRTRAYSHVPLEEAEESDAAATGPMQERAHAARETGDWLRRALARLDERAAEMFVLRFFEGKRNVEIAAMLETTPGTVAVTLCRAKGRLSAEFRAWSVGRILVSN